MYSDIYYNYFMSWNTSITPFSK